MAAAPAAVVGPVAKDRENGFYWNTGGSNRNIFSVRIIVIQAAFGDATLLEVTDDTAAHVQRFYLIDGGPTTYPAKKAPVKVFENLIEVLLKFAKKDLPNNVEEIQLGGIMITHPDGDHVQGIVKLLQKFPPNQDAVPGKVKFNFSGPLLITSAFDTYNDYMKVIENANFKISGVFKPGEPLVGFEKQFNFFYPIDKHPGTLYNYQAAPGGPVVPRRIYARSRYSTDASKMNATSILLVIDDPDTTKPPWASLNGDGLGYSVLQSLNQKHPKIFKVPHHGSVFNSIPLGDFKPAGSLLTARMVVIEALLTKAIDDSDKGIKEHILDDIKKGYANIIKETPPNTKAWNKMAKELSFDALFTDIAADFHANLTAQGLDPDDLLDLAKKRTAQINTNIKAVKKIDDIKEDIYTKNVDAPPKSFTARKYNAAKDATLKAADAAKVRRKKKGYEIFFKILEKDFSFAEDLAFFLTRTFYNQICANSYIISSGSLHRHPSWEIINGIIAAAHDYRKDHDLNYKCRILLTSGNNIKGKKINELYKVKADGVTRDDTSILENNWTDYVKIQYFTGKEAYAILNPNENNPNNPVSGTEKWDSTKTDDELNKLKRKYNSVEGAVALRKKRALLSDEYEIKSQNNNHWLEIVLLPDGSNGIRMSVTKKKIEVTAIGEPEEEESPNTGVYEEIEIEQIDPPVAVKYKIYSKTSHSRYQQLIFIIDDNDDRKYLKANGLALSYVDEISDATYFVFTKAMPRVAAAREIDTSSGLLARRHGGHRGPRGRGGGRSKYGPPPRGKSKYYGGGRQQPTFDIPQDYSSTSKQYYGGGSKGPTFDIPKPSYNPPSSRSGTDTISGGSPGDNSVVIVVEEDNSEFANYLKEIKLTSLKVSTLTIFDAIILLLQSELNGYFVVDSLAQVVVEKILKLPINEKESKVESVSLATGAYVKRANIVAKIPDNGILFDMGFNQALRLNKIEVVYPKLELAYNKIYLSGTATIGNVSVNVNCPMPEPEELPEIEISLPDNTSLANVISLLGVTSSNMPNFNAPLMTPLKDIHITEASVTFRQGIHSLQSFHLSKLALGVSFTNLNSYLPSSFSSLRTINTHVVIYHPKTPPIKIALEVEFQFEIPKPHTKTTETIPLTASFTTRPVDTSSGTPSNGYDFTVAIQAKSTSVIGTAEGGISLTDFLRAFGLNTAVNEINSMPFINSLLNNVQLKRFVLEMNTRSKSINIFSLELCIFEWKLLRDKVTIDQAEFNMYYDNGSWQARSRTVASFGTKYLPVEITLELSNSSYPARFTFTNDDPELTIEKFFEVFGLGSMGNLPVVGEFTKIAVTDAFLEISDTKTGIQVNRGRISLHYRSESESDDINFDYFILFKVDATISVTYNEDQKSYSYGFSISGFINNKLYVSAEYDPNTSQLSGTISIATFKEATLWEVIHQFLYTDDIKNNTIYKDKIESTPSVSAQFILAYDGKYFELRDLEIELKNVITLGSFSLDSLRFEYHLIPGDFRAGILSQEFYSVMGVLSINNKKVGAVLKFDLAKDTVSNIVTASIMPTTEEPLTLGNFMKAIGIAVPDDKFMPKIEGQNLPNFFDISLTQGTITFDAENFTVKAFSIQIKTANEITLLDSPLIKLKQIYLKVDYEQNATPNKISVYLIGVFSIGRVEITLQGSKEPNGDTVFRVLATSDEETSTDLQRSITALTPTDNTSPIIPSDIGIPKPLNVLVAELIVKYSPTNNEKSVQFIGHTQLDWPIDLGFQEFTIKQVGSKIFYKKSTLTQSPPPPQYQVSITGLFQFSDDIQMSSELKFGEENVDTVLSVLVSDVSEVEIPSVADDVLGFKNDTQANSSSNNSVQFSNLLPQDTKPFLPIKAFININFTKKMFGLFCQLRGLGYGFLLAGNFSTNNSTTNYGYTFGISLPEDFKFSELLSPLSEIDTILKVKKANCMVVSISNAKVSDVVAKMKSVQQTAVSKETFTFPFANLTLDTFTNDQDLSAGLSIYCELDFKGFDKGSLFHSIIRISPADSDVASVILSSLVTKNLENAIFKAHISSLTLLGAFELKNVNLIYKPSSNKDTFELNGKITISISDRDNFEFIGKFTCSSTRSEFTVSTKDEKTLVAPLGMVGITLHDIQLSLIYNYPANQNNTSSSQSLSGTVNFYSSSSDVESPTSTPSVVLTGSIIFNNYTPTVVKLVLQPDKPLTIADLVATVFEGSYDTLSFLNIGFVSGQVYYAKLNDNVPSVVIDEVTYKKGYHIAANIEIFDKMFTIEADILPDTKTVSVTGYAQESLDLGFAKLTGSTSDNQVDDTKSPQVVFSTSPNDTSISLVIGFILFGTKLGVVRVGFKREDGINKFFGTLKLAENFDFFLKDIEVEWSKEHGFKVTKWSIFPDDFHLPFNLFDQIKSYHDECGDFVDMVFKNTVKSKFNIDVGLSKPDDPETYVAQINITGTYNILLGDDIVKIASVKIPDISVGILKTENLTLSGLPEYIGNLFLKNADSIVEQIVKDKGRLAKLVSLIVLKNIAPSVVSTLVCRDPEENLEEQIDPDNENADDPTEDDFNDANNEENNFDQDLKEFEDGLEDAIEDGLLDLGEAATSAATAEGSADAAGGILSGIAAGIASFLAVIGIGVFAGLKKKKKEAEDKKDDLDKKKQQKIVDRMTALLDIKQNPQATFQAPSTLVINWNKLQDDSIHFHIVVEGIPIDVHNLGAKTAPPIEIYNDIIDVKHLNNPNEPSITLNDERIYNMVGLRVTMWGTVTGTSTRDSSKSYTYNGKKYGPIDVLKVHPTLFPPTNLQVTYNHSLCQIQATAQTVPFAQQYIFQLIDGNTNALGDSCTVSPTQSTIQCNFPQSYIEDSSVAPFKVRAQSAMMDTREHPNNTGIASSVFVTSNSLQIAPPPANLTFTLPHFMDENRVETINLEWDLPETTTGITGFTGQVFDGQSKEVLVNSDFTQGSLPTLPKTGILNMNTLITAVNGLNYTYSDIVTLTIRISSISNSQQVIDSAFVSQAVISLKSPDDVTANFSAENNTLEISWKYSLQTSAYGVEIADSTTSNVLWSRKELIRNDPVGEDKVGKIYSLTDIAILDNPNTQYSVQVIAVAAGNETFDSFIPNKAPGFLKTYPAPTLNTLTYLTSGFLQVSFEANIPPTYDQYGRPRYDDLLFTINLRKNNEQEVIFTYNVSYQTVVSIFVDQFIDKFNSGDAVKCSIHALGSGLNMTGPEATYINTMTLLPQPTNVVCTYDAIADTFVITATAAPGVQKYLLGFYVPDDPLGYGNHITREITPTGNNISYTLDAYLLKAGTKTWKIYVKSLLTGNSTTQLPSPRYTLDQQITKLNQPQLESFEYSDKNTVKLTIAEPIENAINYKAQIYIIAKNWSVIKNYTKIIPTSQGTELTVDLTEDVSNWDALLEGNTFNEIRGFVAAVGSGYTMTSQYSQLKYITRLEAPSSFTCQYSAADDILNVKFWSLGVVTGTKMAVVVSTVGENNKEISKELVSPQSYQLNSIPITGEEIRDLGGNEWKVHGRMVGDHQIPSAKMTYSTHYRILDTPHITSAAYNVSTTRMGVNWTIVENNSSYKLVVNYETSDEEKHQAVLTAHPEGTGINFSMKDRVPNWGEVSDTSKFALVLTAIAQENGSYLNSKPSADYDIDQQFAFFTFSNESTLSLKWGRKYDNRDLRITSDSTLFTSVQDAEYTEIPKRLFLYPSVNTVNKGITITVDDETTEDHYSSAKYYTVQTQEILETDVLGYNSGGSGQFEDGLSALGSSFVGIKRVEINYNEDSVTRIRVTYRLANGSQYFAPFRGTYSSNQVTIELEDKESIISVSASTSQSRGLSRLQIITQKSNGTCRKFGPYGDAYVIGEVPIRFSGNAISFKGRTDSGGLKNLGFFYTLIAQNLKKSPAFGGDGGVEFENDIYAYCPQVSHVHRISLVYDNLSIVSIKPYYKLSDGTISESYKQGGFNYGYSLTLYPVDITFEEGEILIGISGKSYHNENVPGNVISSLKLTTQKSDGTLKEYGPYGKSEDEEGGNSYITRGRIHGFFGRAGWIIGNLGVYYSLERSEIFGVSGGLDFEDKHPTKTIARLKKLHIRYNSFYIKGVYATYILSDGSTWEAPKHGTSTNTYTPGIPLTSLKTIEFADNEDIISLIVGLQKVTSSQEFSLGYLDIVTQTGDGKRKEYPRVVKTFQPNANLRSEKEFKGRVISLFGRSTTNNVQALGVTYIPIPDEVIAPIMVDVKSLRFGASYTGTGFDHRHTMPKDSPVARVQSLTLQYDSLSLVSITPVYEFENGVSSTPTTQGGPGYSQTVTTKELVFEYGELLIGIKGYNTYDSRVGNSSVSQFSAITQKSDGTITTYGPYGKDNGGSSFMTWGIVNAFFGRSGSIINSIGVYSTLHRTDLIGSNEGIRFSDDHGYFMTVGIKTLKIRHSHKIHSIQATYRTSQGFDWEAPLRGTDTIGTLETLEFAENEDIISIKVTMSGYVVGGLEITTKRRDGSNQKTYPRVGTESEGRDVEIKGRVVKLIGRSQYNVNAIGAKYIPLPNVDD